MRAFWVLCVAVLVAVGAGVGVESTQPTEQPTVLTPPVSAHLTTVRVRPEGPCPAAITGDQDVANPSSAALRQDVLPPGALFGLICRYQANDRNEIVLRRHALVNGRTTALFEAAIGQMNTSVPKGVYACPAAFPNPTLLAFGYADGTSVDLWYADSGCQSLDNGVVRASQMNNPAAFGVLMSLVDNLAPEPLIG